MRTGDDPGAVFDVLLARGRIRLHPDPGAPQQTLADEAATAHAAGEQIAVVADTGEQVIELNAAAERIGPGDRISTGRDDATLQVANRDPWHVTAVDRDGGLRVAPADYVTSHVQLGHASTMHGAQGATGAASHVVIGERTGAASAFVGTAGGRQTTTAHLIAGNRSSAGHQWRQVRRMAGIGPFTLHDLHHFYASGLIASGRDVVTVQRALEHSSATITLAVHSHLWPTAEDRTRAADADLMASVRGRPSDSRRTGGPADRYEPLPCGNRLIHR